MVLEKSSLIIHIPRLLGLGLQVQLRKKWRMQVRAEAMQGRVTTSSSKRSSYTAYGHDKQYNSHSTCKFQENSLGIPASMSGIPSEVSLLSEFLLNIQHVKMHLLEVLVAMTSQPETCERAHRTFRNMAHNGRSFH